MKLIKKPFYKKISILQSSRIVLDFWYIDLGFKTPLDSFWLSKEKKKKKYEF